MSARDLSYSNVFNQQKIIDNGSSTVSVSGAGTLGTVLTVATTETITPTARVFVEFDGEITSIESAQNVLAKATTFFAFFNSANALVVQAVSFDAYDCTIYYRIYKDGIPS